MIEPHKQKLVGSTASPEEPDKARSARHAANQYLEPLAYTPAQAAIVSGRTRTRIFGAIKAEELTAKKDGRATLIEAGELRRWIASMPTISRRPEKAA